MDNWKNLFPKENIYYKTKNGILYNKDVIEQLKQFPDESIDMVITSPPYWGLRFYGNSVNRIWGGDPNCKHEWVDYKEKKINLQSGNIEFQRDWREKASGKTITGFCKKCGAWYGQLGLEPTFYLYINHLLLIFDEVYRILKPTGTLWVNIGDTYGGSGAGTTKNVDIDNYKKKAKESYILPNGIAKSASLRKTKYNKSLLMIPSRFAIGMIERGWILRNEIIWHKPNAMPSSAKDRFTVDFEKIFFFTKNKKYYFEQQFDEFKNPKDVAYRQQLRKNKKYNVKSPYKQNIPYAVQHRSKDIIIYRNLPDIKEFSAYINKFRKKKGYTIEYIEKEIFKNQAPHHWFNGESFPNKEDYLKLKQILELDELYDKQLTEEFTKSAEKQNYIQGRNKRTVWSINTKPFKEAHFAVFPPDLIVTPIKAGCPKYICKKCNTPYLFSYTKEYIPTRPGLNTGTGKSGTKTDPNKSLHNSDLTKYRMQIHYKEGEYKKQCKCNTEETYPGIVLDIFMGAGTTAVVAEQLDRRWVGIELNPEYCEIAKQRVEKYIKEKKSKLF